MLLTAHKKYCSRFVGLVLLTNSLFYSAPIAAETVNTAATQAAKPATPTKFLPLADYLAVMGNDEAAALAALNRIEKFSDQASTAMLIEMLYQVPNRNVLEKLIGLLEKNLVKHLMAM